MVKGSLLVLLNLLLIALYVCHIFLLFCDKCSPLMETVFVIRVEFPPKVELSRAQWKKTVTYQLGKDEEL